MKRLLLATAILLPAFALSACDNGFGYGGTSVGVGYAGSPYAYDGYYDGFYGPIYDGYWGNDQNFYYRRGDGERRFYRGDQGHFDRERARGENFRPMHGSFTPQRGMRTPHFGGGQAGGGRAGGGGHPGGGGHEGRGGHEGGGHGPH